MVERSPLISIGKRDRFPSISAHFSSKTIKKRKKTPKTGTPPDFGAPKRFSIGISHLNWHFPGGTPGILTKKDVLDPFSEKTLVFVFFVIFNVFWRFLRSFWGHFEVILRSFLTFFMPILSWKWHHFDVISHLLVLDNEVKRSSYTPIVEVVCFKDRPQRAVHL